MKNPRYTFHNGKVYSIDYLESILQARRPRRISCAKRWPGQEAQRMWVSRCYVCYKTFQYWDWGAAIGAGLAHLWRDHPLPSLPPERPAVPPTAVADAPIGEWIG